MKHYILVFVLLMTSIVQGAVVYVDQNVSGGAQDGSSWDNAYLTLEAGLASGASEIHVAQGRYSVNTQDGWLISGATKIYGGFPKGGSTLALREISKYQTILENTSPLTPSTIVSVTNNITNLVYLDGLVFSGENAPHLSTRAIYSDNSQVFVYSSIIERVDMGVSVTNTSTFSLINSILTNCGVDDNSPMISADKGSTFNMVNCSVHAANGFTKSALAFNGSLGSVTAKIDNCIIEPYGDTNPSGYTVLNSINTDLGLANVVAPTGGSNALFIPCSTCDIVNKASDCFFNGSTPVYHNDVNNLLPVAGTVLFTIKGSSNNIANVAVPFTDLGKAAATSSTSGYSRIQGALENPGPIPTGTPYSLTGGVIYVDIDASGANNGTSWTDAYKDIQQALNVAADGDEIWVAEGVYIPTMETAFNIKSGVSIYGGFKGTETVLTERSVLTHVTEIQNGTAWGTFSSFNLYSEPIVIDGLVINAIESGKSAFTVYYTDVTIRNCVVGNYSQLLDGSASANNKVLFEGCVVHDFVTGGHIIQMGGMFSPSSLTLYNNTFADLTNTSGAIINISSGAGGTLVVKNNIFSKLSPSNVINEEAAVFQFEYNLWENLGTCPGSCTIIGSIGGVDPEFTNPAINDYSLVAGSQAINAGTAIAGFGLQNDIAGNARVQDGQIDMGAYEFTPQASQKIVYVDDLATGTEDGKSFKNALKNFEDVPTYLVNNPTVKEVWVAEGAYTLSTTLENFADSLAIIGGFGSGGTNPDTTLALRDPAAYPAFIDVSSQYLINFASAKKLCKLSGLQFQTSSGNKFLNTPGVELDHLLVEYCQIDGFGNIFQDNLEGDGLIQFHNNILTNVASDAFMVFDFTSSSGYDVEIIHNSFYAPSTSGTANLHFLNTTSSDRIYVINNLLDAPSFDHDIQLTGVYNTFQVSNNLLTTTNKVNTINDGDLLLSGNIFDGSPNYIDPTSFPGDFYISNASLAINSGVNTPQVTVDMAGNTRVFGTAPDMGAYEFQGTPCDPFTVTLNTDNQSGASGECGDLRYAIAQANLSDTPQDVIRFSLPAGDEVIMLEEALLVTKGNLVIDGTGQTGYQANTLTLKQGFNGIVPVVINGINVDATGILELRADDVAIKSLTFTAGGSFNAAGIYLEGADNVQLENCIVGLDAQGNRGNLGTYDGIQVNNSSNVVIGGDAVSSRCLIGDSKKNGINIVGGSSNVTVNRSYIGVDKSGNVAAPNDAAGIAVESCSQIQIGEYKNSDRGYGNIISGNTSSGVDFHNVTDSKIQNNYIGINADSTTGLSNGGNGIILNATSVDNLVGGFGLHERNIIYGNGTNGIYVNGSSASGNSFYANRITQNTSSAIAINVGQNSITPPLITTFSFYDSTLTGTCFTGAGVQVYADDNNQGTLYLGQASVVGTTWTYKLTATDAVKMNSASITSITAIQTNSLGSTSEFTASYPVDFCNPLLVTSTGDGNACGTLRAAINYANANDSRDSILFDLGMDGQSIILTSQLPNITASGVKVIGDIDGDNVPNVYLDNLSDVAYHLRVTGDSVTINGLAFITSGAVNVTDAYLMVNSADSALIINNRFGTTLDGSALTGSGGAPKYALHFYGSSFGQIGGVNQGNVIGKATFDGILLQNSNENHIIGNAVGVSRDFSTEIGILNADGIDVGGNNNIIGGLNSGEENVVGGISSAQNGITLANPGNGNIIIGNYIGTDPTQINVYTMGIGIGLAANNAIVGGLGDSSNVIKNTIGVGIRVLGGVENTFGKNAIYNNAGGIVLFLNGNYEVKAPIITEILPDSNAVGTSYATTIEPIHVFADAVDQGQLYLGSTTTAIDGTWQYKITAQNILDINAVSGLINLTAIIDSADNSSPFSTPVLLEFCADTSLTIDGPLDFCDSDTTRLSVPNVVGASYQWYDGPSPLSITDTLYEIRTSGSYWVEITLGSCVRNSDTSIATVSIAPVVDAGPDDISCEMSPYSLMGNSLNASGVTWTASGVGIFSPSVNDPNAIYSPSPMDTIGGIDSLEIILTATGTGTCLPESDTMILWIEREADLDAGFDESVCASDGSILLNTTTAINFVGLQWTTSGDGTFDDRTIEYPTYTFGVNDLLNGSVDLTLTSTGSTVCSEISDSKSITLNSPIFTTSAINPTACGVADGELQISGLTDGNSYSVTYYSSGVGTNSTEIPVSGLISISTISGGTTIDSVSVVDVAGCSYTETTALNYNDPDAPVFTVTTTNPTTCGAIDGTIKLAVLDDTFSNYTVSYNDGSIQTLTNQTPINDTIVINGFSAASSVSAIEVDSNNCKTSDASTYTFVDPLGPIISSVIPNNPTSCGVSDGSIEIDGLEAGTYDVVFDSNGVTTPPFNFTSFGSTVTLSALPANSYDNIQITDANGCVTTETGPWILSDPSSVVFTTAVTDLTCVGADGIITLSGFGVSESVDVTFNNGGIIGPVNYTADGSGDIRLENLFAGNYTDIEAEVNGCSYTDAATYTLIEPSIPVFNIATTDPSSCGLTDGVLSIENLTPNAFYDITYNDGGVVGPTNLQADGTGVLQISNLASGNYSSVEVDSTGCSILDPGTYTLVDPMSPSTTITSSQVSVCNANDGAVIIDGLSANLSYSITYDDGVGTVGPTNFMSDGLGSVTIPTLSGGTYSNFNFTSGLCSFSNATSIIVDEACNTAIVEFDADLTSICSGDAVVFTNNTSGASGSETITWDFGTGAVLITDTSITRSPVSVQYTTAGSIDVTLVVTDGNSISNSKVGYINVLNNPSAEVIQVNGSLCNSASVALSVSGGATSYQWYINSTYKLVGETSNTVNVMTEGDYHVEVDAGSCSGITTPVNVAYTNSAPVLTKSGANLSDLSFTSDMSPNSYQWYVVLDGEKKAIVGAVNATYKAYYNGEYHLSITNGNCRLMSETGVFVNNSGFLSAAKAGLSLDGNNVIIPTDEFIGVYPNPAHDEFKLTYYSNEASGVDIAIYDLLGNKKVGNRFNKNQAYFEYEFDGLDLPAGMYLVVVSQNEKKTTFKMYIE